MTLSVLTGADAGTKESELAIVEKAKGPTLSVQTTKAQIEIPQTIQRLESPPIPKGNS